MGISVEKVKDALGDAPFPPIGLLKFGGLCPERGIAFAVPKGAAMPVPPPFVEPAP